MRPSADLAGVVALLCLLGLETLAIVSLAIVGSLRAREASRHEPVNQALVSALALTDLALWSDASYCRHPSQADLFAAHSEHPSALEHFPAGSFTSRRAGVGHGTGFLIGGDGS